FRRHGMVWQEAQTFQSWGYALQGGPNRRAAIEKLDAALAMLRRQDGGQAPAPSSPREVFRREGDYWTLSWHTHVVRLKDAKGLHYIAYLLAHPGCEVFASVLASNGIVPGDRRPTEAGDDIAHDLGDAGFLLDAR